MIETRQQSGTSQDERMAGLLGHIADDRQRQTEQAHVEAWDAFIQEKARADAECESLEAFKECMAEAASKLTKVAANELNADQQARVAMILTAFGPEAKSAIVNAGDRYLLLVEDCISVVIDGAPRNGDVVLYGPGLVTA